MKYELTNLETAISSIRTFVNRADALNYRFMADLNSRDDLILGVVSEFIDSEIKDRTARTEEKRLAYELAERQYERGAIKAESYDKKKTAYNKAQAELAEFNKFEKTNHDTLEIGRDFIAKAYRAGNGKRIALIRAYAENHPTSIIDYEVLKNKLARYSIARQTGSNLTALRAEIVGMVKHDMNSIEFVGTALFKAYVPNFKAREIDFIVDYLTKRTIGRDKDGIFRFKDISSRGLARSMMVFKIMRLQGVKIVAENMKELKELDF